MSYDLFFKPRRGDFDSQRFADYFQGRPHFKLESGQAAYENADTGAYFLFELQELHPEEEGEHFPVAFNINFFRPSYFIREAEPEVAAFVRHFDLLVFDAQTNGMGEGEYIAEKLLSGWDHGNQFAHSVVLGKEKEDRPNVAHLPSKVIHRAWVWNLNRRRLQAQLGESKFVPGVWYFRVDGNVVTGCIWPDGIPVALPPVDMLCIPRKELAPRKWFRVSEDVVFVTWAEAHPVLTKFGTQEEDGVITLGYMSPPPEVVKFVQAIPTAKKKYSMISAGDVSDTELCRPYLD